MGVANPETAVAVAASSSTQSGPSQPLYGPLPPGEARAVEATASSHQRSSGTPSALTVGTTSGSASKRLKTVMVDIMILVTVCSFCSCYFPH